MKIEIREAATFLLILGVLAWVPFLLLVAVGREPSIFPFLAVHLTGVIGGSRLRARSRPHGERRSRRQVWGRILIILGVVAWVPWFYQTELLGRELEITAYLAVHLTGVLSGLGLLLSGPLLRVWQRLRAAGDESGVLSQRESEEVGL